MNIVIMIVWVLQYLASVEPDKLFVRYVSSLVYCSGTRGNAHIFKKGHVQGISRLKEHTSETDSEVKNKKKFM